MGRRPIIPYDPKLKKRARQLRKNGTPAERLLWKYLKGKQLLGFDFDRQRPIDNYIVDFYCKDLRLAIEIDGGSHQNKAEYDKKRQLRLESLGVRFLRFQERDVNKDVMAVLRSIENWIRQNVKTS